jgi:hypothetical protein
MSEARKPLILSQMKLKEIFNDDEQKSGWK